MPLKRIKIPVFLLASFVLILTACPDPEQYPPEPEITFEEVMLFDSVDILGNTTKIYRLKFGIIDGDGNIGLQESDTTGIFDPDSLYSNDFFTILYEVVNGDTIEADSANQRNYRIPYVQPQGQNKTLIADIYIDMDFTRDTAGNLKYDSVFFDFFVVDRDLNQSNIERTPVLKLDTNGIFTNYSGK